MGTKRIKSTAMTDQHLRSPDLPDLDAPAIRHGINARVADIRRRRVPSTPVGERAARPADKGLWAEVR
jgi:hypothetical protein